MKLVRRLEVEARSADATVQAIENDINKALTELQTGDDTKRNGIIVEDIKEITKDSGILVFMVIYEDKSLDE